MTNLNFLLILKKSSAKPVKLKGIRDKKLTWLKILLVIRLVSKKDNPPPRGFIKLCELLWFGISGIIFLNGLIENLVNVQLKIKLVINIRAIFKINLLRNKVRSNNIYLIQ